MEVGWAGGSWGKDKDARGKREMEYEKWIMDNVRPHEGYARLNVLFIENSVQAFLDM